MDYIFLPEASRVMAVPVLLLKKLCEMQKIDGAVRFGQIWAIPSGTRLSTANRVMLHSGTETADDGE